MKSVEHLKKASRNSVPLVNRHSSFSFLSLSRNTDAKQKIRHGKNMSKARKNWERGNYYLSYQMISLSLPF